MRYDITLPLFDGRVRVDGVTFEPQRTSSMVQSDIPALRTGDFGIWDLNLGFWLAAIAAGWDIVALPVFSKRKPVFPLIFCRNDAGIDSPRDLAGKRIGTRQFRTSVAIWCRGLLQERFGVDLSDVRWFAQVPEAFADHSGKAVVTYVPETPSMLDRFLGGEVDVLMTDISDAAQFGRLEGNPAVKRLFPDYRAADLALYREKGIFTPMHLMVMSGPLARAYPGLARRLYDAFVEAKRIAEDDLASDRAGFGVVYLRERYNEQVAEWGDPWAYGIAANRATIDAFVRYCADQGVTRAHLPFERIFADGTLGT
jgi:4,5-dihydroxyphthalate decarboxylase